jgi:hypothetical protein
MLILLAGIGECDLHVLLSTYTVYVSGEAPWFGGPVQPHCSIPPRQGQACLKTVPTGSGKHIR